MARNLERPGCSFHSSRLSIRTGERLEPVKNPSRRSSLLVYRARLSDTQPWLPYALEATGRAALITNPLVAHFNILCEANRKLVVETHHRIARSRRLLNPAW